MSKLNKSKSVLLSKEDRLTLLQGYNNLKNAMDTLDECQDLWLSDMRNIRELMCNLHEKLNFKPIKDAYYSNWVLEENVEKGGNK